MHVDAQGIASGTIDAVLTLRDVRTLLSDGELRPSRALGQNFVVDPNTVRRVAGFAGVGPGDRVVEVGAGLGSLTLALVETGARVVALELDDRLVPLLRAQVEPHGVQVVQGDALTVDWPALLGSVDRGERATGRPWTMVSNLPYNVAVPVVVRLLEAPEVRAMLVMVQREVGERLAAGPGHPAYGAVSVKVAYHATARVVGRVPAAVFYPRPRVESALVLIERRSEPAVEPALVPPDRLFAVVRAGFAHRRKMLRGALADVVRPDSFAVAGIDPRARAEDLSVEQWGRLVACNDRLGQR